MKRYAKVPLIAAMDERLGKNEYKLLIALFGHCHRDSTCHPKRSTLSELTGIPKTRISTITSNLEKYGWIEKTGHGGRSRPPDYVLRVPERVTESVTLLEPERVTETVTVTESVILSDKRVTESVTLYGEKGYRKCNPHTNNKYNYKEKEKINKKEKESGRPRFVKPDPHEVTLYASSIGFALDGEAFCDFYESKGWMVGSNRMKCWKSAVRTWKRRDNGNGRQRGKSTIERYREAEEACDEYWRQVDLGQNGSTIWEQVDSTVGGSRDDDSGSGGMDNPVVPVSRKQSEAGRGGMGGGLAPIFAGFAEVVRDQESASTLQAAAEWDACDFRKH